MVPTRPPFGFSFARVFPALLALALLAAGPHAVSAQAQTSAARPGLSSTPASLVGTGEPTGPAIQGDTVLVILNRVNPDHQSRYERLMMGPVQSAIEEEMGEVYSVARFLKPVSASEDGMLTYIWVADPYVPGYEYSFRSVLEAAYSEEEVARYMEQIGKVVASTESFATVPPEGWGGGAK